MTTQTNSLLVFKRIIPTLAFLATFIFQRGIKNISLSDIAMVDIPPEYLGLTVDPKIVHRFLGLRIVTADLLWLDLLIKADLIKNKDSYSSFYKAARTIVALDPDNYSAYYIAGMYLSVIKDDIKGASALLREGAQYIQSHPERAAGPDMWKVYFMLGYHLIFEELEIEEGSKWVQKAGVVEGAPLYVRSLSEKVSTELGQLEVASRVLSDIYRRISTPEDKAKIEKKMLEVAAAQELADLNLKFKSYLQSTEAYALPKEKAFKLFMRHQGHGSSDILGRTIKLDRLGKIVANNDK